MKLLSLVGEQPMPILLPARFLQPEENLLVCTQRTKKIATHLQNILGGGCRLHDLKAAPYNLQGVSEELHRLCTAGEWMVNLTGATKIMSLAAYRVAQQLQLPFVYLESENRRSLLYRYRFEGDRVLPLDPSQQPVALPELITLDDYLRAHVGGYDEGGYHRGENGRLDNGGLFEQAVGDALKNAGFEVKAGVRPKGVRDQIEIDLAFRLGNQAGIAELKLGGRENLKSGLDQLATAGGREYLGIYTAKFWIIARKLTGSANSLRSLAQARGITIIELPNYQAGKALAAADARQLVDAVRGELLPKPSSAA
ncbi:MAG: DUF1887 family protein [Anaerolineae bacterium]|nr:DUF1887 family protein [Anaerolineae bacterium]